MRQELWERVESLFHAALERSPEAQRTFLDDACAGDTSLREQIELLLSMEHRAGSFLETPIIEQMTGTLSAPEFLINRKIGAYRVISPLGAGGMGEVYRAHDDKLGRDVAIKTLPYEFTRDSERLTRFNQEARTLAALNHPNIGAIYGLEKCDDVDCLVLELVEGENLRGPLPIQIALDYAHQVAEALEAAHAKGIIHRDLKSANIKVTPESKVKLLDFGLAKAIWAHREEKDLSQWKVAGEVTVTGQMVGTPGYMSPEQARGKAIDNRTDIWGFGCVLYELLAGKRAFAGETLPDTITAVLEREPDWSALPAKTPAKIRELLRQCLQKDANRRLDNIAGARRMIEQAQHGWNRVGAVLVPLAVVVSLLILIVTLLLLWLRTPVRLPRVLSSTQITRDGRQKIMSVDFVGGIFPFVTDGSRIYLSEVVTDYTVLAQVPTLGGESVEIPTSLRNVRIQDFSPRRSELLVGNFDAASPNQEMPLWLLPMPSGSARRLDDILANDASWSPDGHSLAYVASSDLYVADSNGSEPHKLTTVTGVPTWPRWSPDGRRLRFTVWDRTTNSSYLWEVEANGHNAHPVLSGWNRPPAECCGSWTPDGKYYVFQSSRHGITSIWALPETHGLLAQSSPEPWPLTTGPMNFYAPLPSADGKKLFVLGEQRRGELVRYDRKSSHFVEVLSGISAQGLDYSRNGEWVTYVTYPEGILWRSKADGSRRLQLTFPPMRAMWPRWSPDGKRIAFAATSLGKPWKIHLVSADGGNAQELLSMDRDETEPNWSPDGNLLVFGRNPFWEARIPAPMAVEILDLRTHETSTLPGSEGLWSPRWSPNGRYISACRPNSKGLSLFDIKTREWEPLSNDLLIGWVSWSADSEYLYLDTIFGNDPAFFRLRIADHKLERIVSLKSAGRAFGDMYWWSGITPDGSPLVLRDVGTQEIYALDWEAP